MNVGSLFWREVEIMLTRVGTLISWKTFESGCGTGTQEVG